MTELIREFGIEHDVPGSARGIYASNFRSAADAQSYIDARIDARFAPRIMIRHATPRALASEIPDHATTWQPYDPE